VVIANTETTDESMHATVERCSSQYRTRSRPNMSCYAHPAH